MGGFSAITYAMAKESGGGGGGGTDNYNSLKNLPQINGTTLKGNKTASDLGLPSVVANPTGEAVGELTSIDINGSKYSIPESSEYEETTVWTGSGDMLSSFTATITNPYTDYDALRFEYKSGNGSHNYMTHYDRVISKSTLSTPEWFSISDFYLSNGAGVNSVGRFTDTTHLSVKLHSVNWFTSCTLTKIVGIKYGNGVGGGGGGAYTTTVLFTNGASGDTTFKLSSDYTNFDAIAIHYSHSDGQDSYKDVRTYPTTFLNSVSSTDDVLGFTNDVWYYYFSVYSTTEFRYVKSNAGYITDIIGIKYGSNSGGGGGDEYEDVFSADEVLTNKTWYGKPVYRKCWKINPTIQVSNGWASLEISVADLNIETIVESGATGVDINETYSTSCRLAMFISRNVDTNKLDAIAGSYNVYVDSVFIEYTKTTD